MIRVFGVIMKYRHISALLIFLKHEIAKNILGNQQGKNK